MRGVGEKLEFLTFMVPKRLASLILAKRRRLESIA
jgi:hypothetical protein